MSIFDRFKKGTEQRQFFPFTSNYFSSGLFSAELNPVVDNAVSKISSTISILPLSLYVHTKTGAREAWWDDNYRLLKNPCVEETQTLFIKNLVRHLLLKGNAYIYKGKVNGKVAWLQLVDPSAVSQVARDASGRKYYTIVGDRGGVYTDNEIIHIVYIDEGYNGTIGRSPVEVHKDLIEQNNILNEYISLYFKNGINSKLIFELGDKFEPGSAKLEKLVQELNQYYQHFWAGSKNSGLPGILPPGTKASMLNANSNVQAQLKESLEYSEAAIYKIFNIPPEVLMSSENKYGSLTQKNADFLQSCIQPLCKHICESLEKGLIDDPGMYISFDYNGLIETDLTAKQDRLIKGFNNGLYTLNEVRQQLNMPSIDNDVEGGTRVVSAALLPWTEENIKAILAKSKISLMEADVTKKEDGGHAVVGMDKNV